MKLLILAAGYATRLYPLTLNQPKPLLSVGGKPMIDHVIEKFALCPELDEVEVVTNHKFAGHFEAWAKEAEKIHKKKIQVFDDGTTSDANKLGAIGDIHFVMQKGGIHDDLIVVAGDNLFSDPLEHFARDAKQKGLLVGAYDVRDWEVIKKYANISLDDGNKLTFFEEKPQNPQSTLAAIALYHYPKNILPRITQYIQEGNNPDQPGRLVQWLYTREPVHAYLVRGQWMDIGSKETYEEANKVFAKST